MPTTPALRVRRTRAELRELMLEAASEVLLDQEPTLGHEDLTYQAVFTHLETTRNVRVTHASVHERIWSNLREFQLDTIAWTMRSAPAGSYHALTSAVREAADRLDLVTVAGRRYATQELLRLAIEANWRASFEIDRAGWYFTSIRLRLSSIRCKDSVERQRVESAVKEARMASTAMFASHIEAMFDLLGLRPTLDMERTQAAEFIARSTHALLTGYSLDHLLEPVPSLELPTGPAGEFERWAPVAWATWNLLRSVVELDGDGLTAHERRL